MKNPQAQSMPPKRGAAKHLACQEGGTEVAGKHEPCQELGTASATARNREAVQVQCRASAAQAATGRKADAVPSSWHGSCFPATSVPPSWHAKCFAAPLFGGILCACGFFMVWLRCGRY